MASNFRIQLEDWLKTLDIKAEKALDVGGLQFPLPKRTKSWDVTSYKIFDLEKEMDGRKADYVGDISRALTYHKDIDELEDEFDAIFCFEVMEYVFDPMQTLENMWNFLKRDGKLYISFPFVYPMHPPLDTDFLRYTRHGVLKLLEESRFKDVEIVARRAGMGRSTLKRFYDEEGMKYRRDDYSLLDEIGYVVIATK